MFIKNYFLPLRRRANANPAKPMPNKAKVVGSGVWAKVTPPPEPPLEPLPEEPPLLPDELPEPELPEPLEPLEKPEPDEEPPNKELKSALPPPQPANKSRAIKTINILAIFILLSIYTMVIPSSYCSLRSRHTMVIQS